MVSVKKERNCVGWVATSQALRWGICSNVPTLVNPYRISVGVDDVCALDDSGLVCWGGYFSPEPFRQAMVNPRQIDAGYGYACAIDDNGLQCWGGGVNGQGEGMPTLVNPVQVSVGFDHTCAIDDSGVHCWGNGDQGQTAVPALLHPVQVSASAYFSCALDDRGVHCWGDIPAYLIPPDDLPMDPDGDGVNNQRDAFPLDASKSIVSKKDWDGDGVKNNKDSDPYDPLLAGDLDKDGVDMLKDNCPKTANADQADLDRDNIGDVCDKDRDGDGVTNRKDRHPDDPLLH